MYRVPTALGIHLAVRSVSPAVPAFCGMDSVLLLLGLSSGLLLASWSLAWSIPMLPYIAGAYSTSLDHAIWSLTFYLLAWALAVVPATWLYQRFGELRMFQISLTLLMVATLPDVFSDHFGLFLGGRFLQGTAAGFLTPLTLCADSRRRLSVQRFFGTVDASWRHLQGAPGLAVPHFALAKPAGALAGKRSRRAGPVHPAPDHPECRTIHAIHALALGLDGAGCACPRMAHQRATPPSGGLNPLSGAQVDSENLARFGLSVGQAFSPCTNVKADAPIMAGAYVQVLKACYAPGASALTHGFEAYNSGNTMRVMPDV